MPTLMLMPSSTRRSSAAGPLSIVLSPVTRGSGSVPSCFSAISSRPPPQAAQPASCLRVNSGKGRFEQLGLGVAQHCSLVPPSGDRIPGLSGSTAAQSRASALHTCRVTLIGNLGTVGTGLARGLAGG